MCVCVLCLTSLLGGYLVSRQLAGCQRSGTNRLLQELASSVFGAVFVVVFVVVVVFVSR